MVQRVLLSLIFLAVTSAAWATPRQIEHSFGTTVIVGTPQRVVSLSYIGHDFLLALGVKPVALRNWYGGHPRGVWPWAEEALGEAEPVILYGGIDIEQIALLKPDLIVGQWSGMTENEYRLLSQIAPTLPPAKGEIEFSTSWQIMTQQLGRALNRKAKAEAVVKHIEDRFAAIRAARPEWKGKEAAIGWPSQIGVFTQRDLRGRFLKDLGFALPKRVTEMAGNASFFVTLPQEDPRPLDVDVMIWVHTPGLRQALEGIVLRDTLSIAQEGREVHADADLTAALAHSSPLSLEYALDRLVPLIDAAIDGAPATAVEGMVAERAGSGQ